MSVGLDVEEIAQLMDLHVDVVRASLARLEARGLARRLPDRAAAEQREVTATEGEVGPGIISTPDQVKPT